MSSKYAPLLKALFAEPWWQEVMADLKADTPSIPPYDPEGPNAEDHWKWVSGVREGYRLCLSKLGVTND